MKKQTILLFLLLFCGLQLFSQEQDTILTECDFSYSNEYDSLLQFRNLLGNIYWPLTTAEDTLSVKNIVDNCYVYDSFVVKAKEIESYRPFIQKYGFPSNTKIIEYRQIQNYGIKNRAIVYWIESPFVSIYCEEDYDCSSSMTGHGTFNGKIRFSLVDTENSRIINTINYSYIEFISDEKGNIYKTTCDCNSMPFSSPSKSSVLTFGSRSYFTVIGGDSIKEGLTEIIHLDDYNGDGLGLEFPIFVPSGGCMGCESTLFGYSIKQDKIIQYQTFTTSYSKDDNDKEMVSNEIYYWLGYTFTQKFVHKKLKYQIDFRGRGGCLAKYDLFYDEENECFKGIQDFRITEFDKDEHPSWISSPEKTE